ncbi:16S rRNA m(7)G-527 methyltransferase [Scopulibacillus darangshiensis]|uniref:Ribosomal RNA small subunit methyltransferase G n=1 Tax=Scopulibacillus darangshiensis TaxID=442528 RepID=A0A4R2NFV9_9BACL|nr:16S rRNA m(7)G-527 methyltransferase [Scopulibacillus darangshiensis]
METTFTTLLEEKGFTLSPFQIKQFHTYYQLLVEWNEKINLTAITERDQVYLKHFYDSLTPSFYLDFDKDLSLCDVGSGAGFPSIPLKIIFPNLKVSIVDALQKRLSFLDELVKKLSLENVSLYHDRAETFGQNNEHRESFDIVTARAVAKLSVLSEYCLPLVKLDGIFLALKGASADEEVKSASKAINSLGGRLNNVQTLLLPEEKSHRHLIFIDKIKKTPNKYPRKPGTPNKSPL